MIISIYRHPNSFPSSTWNDLIKSIDSHPQVILLGDFNAHHYSWGSSHSDAPGNSFYHATLYNSLISLNSGFPTYITRPGQKPSILNLTFVSPTIYSTCSWTLLDDNLNSDHIPVVITIDLPIKARKFYSHKLNYSKLN